MRGMLIERECWNTQEVNVCVERSGGSSVVATSLWDALRGSEASKLQRVDLSNNTDYLKQ